MLSLKDSDGKIEWIKILVPLLILWGSYVTFQAYEVGSNKEAIRVTAENLRRDIDKNSDTILRNNGVLHSRISKESSERKSETHNLRVLLMDTWKVMLNFKEDFEVE